MLLRHISCHLRKNWPLCMPMLDTEYRDGPLVPSWRARTCFQGVNIDSVARLSAPDGSGSRRRSGVSAITAAALSLVTVPHAGGDLLLLLTPGPGGDSDEGRRGVPSPTVATSRVPCRAASFMNEDGPAAPGGRWRPQERSAEELARPKNSQAKELSGRGTRWCWPASDGSW